MQPVDLNLDGEDELIARLANGPADGGAIAILTAQRRAIAQVNFAGRVEPLHFVDVDADTKPEILVPWVRSDSLFVTIVGSNGQKRHQFYIAHGTPRQEDGGTLMWDAAISKVYLKDLDGDGTAELISLVYTGYAGMPRGVWVHRMPNGEPLGHYLFGALPNYAFLDDFDGNGVQEMLISSYAADNGASANDIDDQHAYLMHLEFTPEPQLKKAWERGGVGTNLALAYQDFNGDGTAEFLVHTFSNAAYPNINTLELLEPSTWKVLQRRELTTRLGVPQVLDLNLDTVPEIVILHAPNEIWVLNNNLQDRGRYPITPALQSLATSPDLDNDGVPEILGFAPNNDAYFLDRDLTIKAAFPSVTPIEYVQRGVDASLGIIFQRLDEGKKRGLVLLSFVRNQRAFPFSSLHWSGWGLGLLGLIGLALGFFVWKRQASKPNPSPEPSLPPEPPTAINKQPEASPRVPDHAFIDSVHAIVEKNYANRLFGVAWLADEMGLSKRQLVRKSRQELNTTPSAFIRKWRVEQAKMLLCDMSRSLDQIAQAVGYAHHSALRKAFLKVTGMTPRAYRQKHC